MNRNENDRERRSATAKPRASRPAAPRPGAAAKSAGRTKAAAEKAGAGPKPAMARPTASRAGKAAAALRAVTEDDIRLRAYEIYLRRGCSHGRDIEDWLQAERELKALHKID